MLEFVSEKILKSRMFFSMFTVIILFSETHWPFGQDFM